MQEIEYTLNSREVADMLEKEHGKLLRDLRRYEEQFAEAKIGFSNFFSKSEYKDSTGRVLPCYQITKKGCEFLAHKLTGTKGTIFTARYINRFHEMQYILSRKAAKPELPWFIRQFQNRYIMLFRDFKSLTGVEIFGNYTAWDRIDQLKGGLDYTGWAWYTTVNRKEFLKEYGFDYGDDKCMYYLFPSGIKKSLYIYKKEGISFKQDAYDLIYNGLNSLIPKQHHTQMQTLKPDVSMQPLLQIQILGNENYPLTVKQ